MSGNLSTGQSPSTMRKVVLFAGMVLMVCGCGKFDLMNVNFQNEAAPPANKAGNANGKNESFIKKLRSEIESMEGLGDESDELLKSLDDAEKVLSKIQQENRIALQNANRQVRVDRASHSPNIVMIVSPRLGWGDLGAYGQKKIPTPYLDGLAKNGVVFTDFYGGAPTIPASQWALQTGYTVNRSTNGFLIPKKTCTLAETLWQGGYHTGFFGMWLAPDKATVEDSPRQHGFDVWSGQLLAKDSEIIYPKTLWVNDKQIQLPKTDEPVDVGDLTVQAAIAEMERSAAGKAGKRPFFLMVVLPPYVDIAADFANEKLTDKTDWPQNAQSYGAAVRLTDRDVGRILAALDRLELTPRTSVFFTALTGSNDSLPKATEYFQSTGPFRTSKSTLGEGNLRVPFIASFPGYFLGGGRRVGTPGAVWDVLPTLANLTFTQQYRKTFDGVSLYPLLYSEDVLPPRLLYWQTTDGTAQAVRFGEWKGLKPAGVPALELFNLTTDPGETKNVAGEHPEIIEQMIKPAN